MPKNEQEIEIILTLLCAAQVVHEKMDDLQHLKFYKHSLKQAAKRFEEELTKTCDPIIAEIFHNDEEMFNTIMRGIELVGRQLATLDPVVIGRVALLIDEQNQKHKNELEQLPPTGGENDVAAV